MPRRDGFGQVDSREPVSMAFVARQAALSAAIALSATACAEKFSSANAGPAKLSDGGAEAAAAAADIPVDAMLLWLRADEGVSQQSGRVSRWDDQSPSKQHAVQDVASTQPTFLGDGFNGEPAVLFDGADDFLQLESGFTDFS